MWGRHGSHVSQQIVLVLLQVTVLQDPLHDTAAVGVLAQADDASLVVNPARIHHAPLQRHRVRRRTPTQLLPHAKNSLFVLHQAEDDFL